uniref:Uncharacterized protein n=1 Tax=Timema cristinae TaxID=61476 RepID=A0A7R9DB59_TIMCR|nr:unnamed protein product [Timema cristinae]
MVDYFKDMVVGPDRRRFESGEISRLKKWNLGYSLTVFITQVTMVNSNNVWLVTVAALASLMVLTASAQQFYANGRYGKRGEINVAANALVVLSSTAEDGEIEVRISSTKQMAEKTRDKQKKTVTPPPHPLLFFNSLAVTFFTSPHQGGLAESRSASQMAGRLSAGAIIHEDRI